METSIVKDILFHPMSREGRAAMEQFFGTAYSDLAGQWLHLWKFSQKDQVKESFFTQQIDGKTIDQILQLAESFDVYVGCGLRPKNYGPHDRGKAECISGITGFWLDVDYGPGHKKANLPHTKEDAMDLIQSMGLPPSLIVHSGHGFQPWWLFKEPWIFENEEERKRAMTVCSAWSRTLIAQAKARGWTADNVGDLARVMRIPGTWNHKNGQMVPVEFDSICEARYDPSEFDDLLLADIIIDAPEAPLSTNGSQSGGFVLRADATPPFEKFNAFKENDDKFRGSWNRTRKMDSASEYDLSLATLAMMAGWDPQEIVNLLIASRRKHGDDLKLREDYYARTLSKAMASHRHHRALEELDVLAEAPANSEAGPSGESEQERARTMLSTLLGRNIEAVRKYGDQPSEYDMVVEGKTIFLGGWPTSTIKRSFVRSLWMASSIKSRLLKRLNGSRWSNCCSRPVTKSRLGRKGIAWKPLSGQF